MEDVTKAKGIDDDSPVRSRLDKAVFFMLFVIMVFTTIAYGAVDAWALGVISLLTALIACMWVGDSLLKKEFRVNTGSLQLPLLALLLLGVIQLLPLGSSGAPAGVLSGPASNSLSFDPYATRFFLIQLVACILFFGAVLVFLDHRKRFRKMVFFIIIFVAIMAFFGTLQRIASPDAIYGLRSSSGAITFGTFINQHHFAALMEMASALTLALLFGGAVKKDRRILLAVAAVMMGIAMIFTGSRGGLLSYLAVIGFIFAAGAFAGKKSSSSESDEEEGLIRNKWMLAGAAVALIVTIFGLVFLLGGDQSLLRVVGVGTEGDFSTGRTHFWSVALKIFWNNPIIGTGLDAFGNAYPLYDTWNGTYRVERAHNEYLQMLADGGIIGFACVAAFIFLLFRAAIGVIRSTTDTFRKYAAIGALAGCFGVMVHSFFDFPLRTPANAFFFLVLAALATVTIYYPSRRRR